MSKIKRTFTVYLHPKQGYNKRLPRKVVKRLEEAVTFAHRAVGHLSQEDPRYWQNRPQNRNPWSSVSIYDSNAKQILFIANNW